MGGIGPIVVKVLVLAVVDADDSVVVVELGGTTVVTSDGVVLDDPEVVKTSDVLGGSVVLEVDTSVPELVRGALVVGGVGSRVVVGSTVIVDSLLVDVDPILVVVSGLGVDEVVTTCPVVTGGAPVVLVVVILCGVTAQLVMAISASGIPLHTVIACMYVSSCPGEQLSAPPMTAFGSPVSRTWNLAVLLVPDTETSNTKMDMNQIIF